ncbi:MAG: DNA polymerase I [Bacilli bacterium]|nr:DNA polymerase I [Bacilli bacterium]MDD4547781.1 DNA polymerase I [Bacilli bacterium]
MEKIIMVDGNNLLFRSYYATAYNGNFMQNSKGFPTNAIYGFVNMINKIINEENPIYMIVAFDKGRTFRHDKYNEYKAGRIETPDELKKQFPIAKEILTHMGVKYYEIDDYEADDIIGTFSQYCDDESKYIGTIISSDKDLLQLISTDVDIKLLKQKDYIRYNDKNFFEEYGIEPIKVIDLKALQGDPSDNIPGVKGIGEKTALKLLQEYGSLDNIYQNIDNIKGKLKEKLIADKENAYLSYELATIVKDVPMEICIDDIKYTSGNHETLNKIYEELEFYSFLKKDEVKTHKKIEVNIINNVDDIKIDGTCAVYLEILGVNYHQGEILGMGVYNDQNSFFIPKEVLLESPEFLKTNPKYTYDIKKMYVSLKWQGIEIDNVIFDTMLAGYLLDYNVKDDLAYMANQMNYDIPFYDKVYGKTKFIRPDISDIAYNAIVKAKFIYESRNTLHDKMEQEETLKLYNEIDFPLAIVLADMEFAGVNVDKNILSSMGEEIKIKIELLSNDIYNDAGIVFNISSPSQLGEILFERLGLKHGKKGKTGYSTAIDVLNKLKGSHPIIEKIIEYRTLTKLYTTYIDGLLNTVMDDNKIHTIYNQTLTRTGRLSSVEPNLQNIPIRYEYGRLIRKAFVPSTDSLILSCDYSQIELRILAHMSKVDALIDAFNKDMDIHTKTAMDIFKVEDYAVTSNMRRIAKAVNFGIIYGISSFGLSENLDILISEAKDFIDEYLATYPGIKEYMDNTVKDAYEKGYVKTLFNRKRNILELSNKNYMIRQQGERIALNTPIQGTSADIIKKSMIEIAEQFEAKELKSKMILQVHDELIFDVLESELDIVTEIVKTTMENTYKLLVPLKVDINYGTNWYQAK